MPDADVTLEEFGVAPHPPFPCVEELLYEVPGSGEMLNCPLIVAYSSNVCLKNILSSTFWIIIMP
jgi:hypothetical protein